LAAALHNQPPNLRGAQLRQVVQGPQKRLLRDVLGIRVPPQRAVRQVVHRVEMATDELLDARRRVGHDAGDA
jgi:hypothetical protein